MSIKEHNKLEPVMYLNKYELLMKSHYTPYNLSPESIFFSAVKSYVRYNGNYDEFLLDNNLNKFNIYYLVNIDL